LSQSASSSGADYQVFGPNSQASHPATPQLPDMKPLIDQERDSVGAVLRFMAEAHMQIGDRRSSI
jgi:hypothetical protein